MRKKPRPPEPLVLADGWWWYRNFIFLKSGGYNFEWRIARVEAGRVQPFGMKPLEPGCRYPSTPSRLPAWHLDRPVIVKFGKIGMAHHRQLRRRQACRPSRWSRASWPRLSLTTIASSGVTRRIVGGMAGFPASAGRIEPGLVDCNVMNSPLLPPSPPIALRLASIITVKERSLIRQPGVLHDLKK